MSMRVLTSFIIALILVTTAPAFGLNELEQSLVGTWQGELDAGGMKLRLVLHLEETEDKLTATIDSPDQGAKGIPVDEVNVQGDSLQLKLFQLMATYEAAYHPADDSLSGVWAQGGMELPLAMIKSDAPIEMNRPQEPQPPLPYISQEVTFFNKRDSIMLAGTLTMPESGGAFPAAVLISGSGPQDRNEEIVGHKPFMVIADHLTRNGIAVLRFDDRGYGESEGDFQTASSQDFASDVVAAVEYLRIREEVVPGKIGLIGHSEGGMVAPMVAAENDEIAFLVLLAGTGVPGAEIIALQERRIMEVAEIEPEMVEMQAELRRDLLDIATGDKPIDEKREALRSRIEERREGIPEEKWQEEGVSDVFVAATVEQMLSPWMQFFLTYDPAKALKQVDCPVLALNGELDLQVIPEQNLPAIEAALEEGGNSNYKTVELEGLNHLFQHAETGHPMEYSRIEETFAPEALEMMTEWILEVVN